MATKTARVMMLGNAFEYEVGREYEVDIRRANELAGLGYARIVDAAAQPAKEVDDEL